ncbi:MAG: hypothetical protein ACI9PY_000604 [Ascidiaceihabitans sp.]|jgi:hypothetical protein
MDLIAGAGGIRGCFTLSGLRPFRPEAILDSVLDGLHRLSSGAVPE